MGRRPLASTFDADVIVVGSGFGGSVTALRLSEAGHRVIVLEQGKELSDADLASARRDPRAYLWAPTLGMRGFFWQRILRHVAVIGGAGVGGGSIVWAGVLLEPGDDFYQSKALTRFGIDWRAEMRPHYAEASRMLGRVIAPHVGTMDEHLRATAERMGRDHTYGPVPVAIHFGQPGVVEPDPFFGGEGPDRTGCRLCGECLLGCPYGAKNQLTRNYLYLARQRGAEVRAETQVRSIRPSGDGYAVETGHPWRNTVPRTVTARHVVVAAGVLGTVELLARCRDELGTLPQVSPSLGRHVRTNSEAITAILHPAGTDLSHGPTISSDFHPDEHTHTTQNRYMGGWHMRAQVGPLVDDDEPGRRARRVLSELARRPGAQMRTAAARDFLRRLTVLTTMQRHDSELALRVRRSRVLPWQRTLQSEVTSGSRPPSNLTVANAVTATYAELSGGRPLNLLGESVGGLSVTAHVLGGAVMGRDRMEGVVDARHEVFGYPGLFVADASVIPANLGVNPSLTITAFAERFAQLYVARFAPGDQPVASPARPRPPGGPVSANVLALRRAWSSLTPALATDLVGDHEAEFVAPLRRVAPFGLGLIGLPRWYGKRFALAPDGSVTGVNLLRAVSRGLELAELQETMPMTVRDGVSKIDGRPAVIIDYAPGTRAPWPWVRDELRLLDEGTVVGMTVVDVRGLSWAGGTPFLLRRR